MYENILIPTDGSPTATQAAEQAFDLAELCSAAVHILHVIQLPHRTTVNTVSGVEDLGPSEEMLSNREKVGEQLTSALAEDASGRGLDTVTEVTKGFVPNTILGYVTTHDIDLIVMGTHGRSGLNRWLLGSVTERVIRQASIPVHVVRASESGR